MEKTVTHHIHYKEIHGFDEIVKMTKSDHVKLHKRLRRKGECNIPALELHKISQAACRRAHPEVVGGGGIKNIGNYITTRSRYGRRDTVKNIEKNWQQNSGFIWLKRNLWR